jgi:cell division protein FtsB
MLKFWRGGLLLIVTVLLAGCGGDPELRRDLERLKLENEALRRDLERFQNELMRLSLELEDGAIRDLETGRSSDEEPAALAVLDLESTPWAEVYLDGVRLGETPLTKEVVAGNFILDFRCTACDPQQRSAVGASVKPGETFHRHVRFNP